MENLETGDESCATTVPAIRLLPRFALHVAELEPARAAVGNSGGEYELRVVTAALMTSEDVIERADANGAGSGIGLRGGSFVAEAASTGYRIQLRNVRWTEDLTVSGHIDWPGRSGTAKADLELHDTRGAGGGKLELQWSEGVGGSLATARGELDGKEIVAADPAP
jgi:hypothetical protein